MTAFSSFHLTLFTFRELQPLYKSTCSIRPFLHILFTGLTENSNPKLQFWNCCSIVGWYRAVECFSSMTGCPCSLHFTLSHTHIHRHTHILTHTILSLQRLSCADSWRSSRSSWLLIQTLWSQTYCDNLSWSILYDGTRPLCCEEFAFLSFTYV